MESKPKRELSDKDKEFLYSQKFFKLLPENSRELLTAELESVTLPEGTTFIKQGDEGDSVYFIQEGSCEILVETDDEKRFKVADRGAGEMVGEMALITDEPRQAYVVAASPVRLSRLSRERFVALVEDNYDLQEFLTSLVVSRLESAARTAERSIGKYRIEHKLGHGAWAIVYQGRHAALGKKVAIKMLKHQMAMVEDFHDRFLKEATIIADMQHPNIINVFDVEERFKTIFIIMEYLDGTPLDELLKANGALPVDQVVDIFKQVCAGLSYAHNLGIVHQDIKPENLYLMPNGRIKILDFGLACPFGSENMEMEGTIQYMSPEQIDSYPVDARTDIYCLGITAFELLTGKQPYPGDDIGALMELHLNEEIPDPADFIENVPPILSECIRKCCRRNHLERYQSAEEASQALDGLLQSETPAEPVKQNMSSLYMFYNDEQKSAVSTLLEEFSQRAKDEGIVLQLVDFEHVLG